MNKTRIIKVITILILVILTLLMGCVREVKEEVEIIGEASKSFGIYMGDGRLYVNYTGEYEYGIILLFKSGRVGVTPNAYKIKFGYSETISLPYGSGVYTLKFADYKGLVDLDILGQVEINANIEDEVMVHTGLDYFSQTGDIPIQILTSMVNNIVYESFKYTRDNIYYNYNLEEMVLSGVVNIHKPNIKNILESRVGICADKASLMMSIVRFKYPARKVVGYNNINEWHAWVEVHIEGEWKMFDPTSGITYKDNESKQFRAVKYY